MTRVYTRFGDQGETRLFDGTRVRKDHVRVDAYGAVDELNAVVGSAGALTADTEIRQWVERIQRELLALGAQLADPEFRNRKSDKGRIQPGWVEDMEVQMDAWLDALPKLDRFILSGGGPSGATLHVARTVCRRAERAVIGLTDEVDVDPGVIVYLNRLSDLLFVMARVINHREGMEEIQW
jgi:cob(I)alamin adenosyltransferase